MVVDVVDVVLAVIPLLYFGMVAVEFGHIFDYRVGTVAQPVGVAGVEITKPVEVRDLYSGRVNMVHLAERSGSFIFPCELAGHPLSLTFPVPTRIVGMFGIGELAEPLRALVPRLA